MNTVRNPNHCIDRIGHARVIRWYLIATWRHELTPRFQIELYKPPVGQPP